MLWVYSKSYLRFGFPATPLPDGVQNTTCLRKWAGGEGTRSQRWDPVSIFHKRNHCSAPDSNLAMQSSFRSCKRPGTIHLLLTVGTDNLLAGMGDHDKSEWGRLLHEHRSCSDTAADTNMLSSGERKSLPYWCISSSYISSIWSDLCLSRKQHHETDFVIQNFSQVIDLPHKHTAYKDVRLSTWLSMKTSDSSHSLSSPLSYFFCFS